MISVLSCLFNMFHSRCVWSTLSFPQRNPSPIILLHMFIYCNLYVILLYLFNLLSRDFTNLTHLNFSRTSSWNNRRGSKGNAVYAQRAIQGQGHWAGGNGYEKRPLSVTYSGPDHMSVPHAQGPISAGSKPVVSSTPSR